MIGAAGRADAGAFLARLIRMDPAALVRLRPLAAGSEAAGAVGSSVAGPAEMWARLPFGVLVVRTIPEVATAADMTVDARWLLGALTDPGVAPPERRDTAWRWSLPSSRGHVVERLPEAEVARVAAAASRTLRIASTHGVGGRRVGERVVRDALLDHVPILVTGSDPSERVEVSQRLVQAVVRMGFLRSSAAAGAQTITVGDTSITVRRAGMWICLDASYGSAWYKPISTLTLS